MPDLRVVAVLVGVFIVMLAVWCVAISLLLRRIDRALAAIREALLDIDDSLDPRFRSSGW